MAAHSPRHSTFNPQTAPRLKPLPSPSLAPMNQHPLLDHLLALSLKILVLNPQPVALSPSLIQILASQRSGNHPHQNSSVPTALGPSTTQPVIGHTTSTTATLLFRLSLMAAHSPRHSTFNPQTAPRLKPLPSPSLAPMNQHPLLDHLLALSLKILVLNPQPVALSPSLIQILASQRSGNHPHQNSSVPTALGPSTTPLGTGHTIWTTRFRPFNLSHLEARLTTRSRFNQSMGTPHEPLKSA